MQAAKSFSVPLAHRGPKPGTLTRRGAWLIWVTVVMLGLTGCAGFQSTPSAPQYDSHRTQDLLAALYDVNGGLVSGKWIGKVSMTFDGDRRTFDRAVWAGAEPGRVRFDARTPFGLPVVSLACDESYVTAVTHTNGQYYRRRVGDNSLGRVLPVDISCRDLYLLLTGRPPVIDYHSAHLENTVEGTQTIWLKRRFKGTVAKLRVDAASGTLTGVELLDIHGNRRYWARLAQQRPVDGFLLPHRLLLQNAQGELDFEIGRLYPNRPVTASLFQIAPPK